MDDKKLTVKVRRKVWAEFQCISDEFDFLDKLKRTDTQRYDKFMEEFFTNEEKLRIAFILKTIHPLTS